MTDVARRARRAVTLTTAWQRFKITGTMTGGADRRSGWRSATTPERRQLDHRAIYAWGACLQQGNDPKNGVRPHVGLRRPSPVAAGVACGALLVVGEGQRGVAVPGRTAPDRTSRTTRSCEVTAGGELIIAGGTGNGYRLAELMGATNPSGWSGVLKVKNPAGVTAGYILLYSNP